MEMNKYLQEIEPSVSAELMQKAKDMKAAGEDIIGLAGGEPDFDTPDKIRFAGIQSICKGDTHYQVGPGLPELREKITEKLRNKNGIDCTPEHIVVTPGGKYAIYLAVRALINVGEEVIILDPSWVSYEPIVKSAGGHPVHVCLDYESGYKIDAEKLEAAVSDRTKLLIINYPNNPTGCILSREEAEILIDFVKRHKIYIISDEIYEQIIYDDKKMISLGSFHEIGKYVITVNGFSKAYAMTGWRLGYLAAQEDVIKMMKVLYSHTMTGVCSFIQKAALMAFECEEEVKYMRKIYENRRNFFITELNQITGVSARMPEGAFYAWVKFEKENMSSYQLADFLLKEAKVVGVPGEAYGKGAKNCIRFSFATSENELKEAVQRIKKVIL